MQPVFVMFSAGSGLNKVAKLCLEDSVLLCEKRVSTTQDLFFSDLVNPNPGDNAKSRDYQVFLPV